MSRSLPAVETSVSPITVGFPDFPSTVEDWSYDALLVSEGHRRIPTGWSGGGPLFVVHASASHWQQYQSSSSWTEWGSNRGAPTFAGVYPLGTVGGWFRDVAISRSVAPDVGLYRWPVQREELSALFAKGYQRARPDAPQAGLGQFLVELRDLPRVPGRIFHRGAWTVPLGQIPRVLHDRLASLIQNPRYVAKGLADEYLNLEFGWRPFVQDVREMYSLWKRLDKVLADLKRQNGKWQRRYAALDKENATEVVEDESVPYGFFGVGGGNLSHVLRPTQTLRYASLRTERKTWFVGSFRYWIPDVSSSLWNARARAALFGALPTPQVLWEVMPWSWLIDWFLDVDDTLGWISPGAVDNLVCRYSYIMRREKRTLDLVATTIQSGADNAGSQVWPELRGQDGAVRSRFITETKARVPGGNPFGGSVNTTLTSRQVGILAALGISRGL